jgi:membrane fusion protein (multidrug efflux system)
VHYLGVTAAIDHDDDELSVGARVRATIRVEQPDAIVVPRQAVFEVHGKSNVYRLDDGGFEPVEVQLGASSPGRVVIEKGLSPGDRIALRDPTVAADALLGADEAGASAQEDGPRGPAGAP